MLVSIPASVGELVDKITILRVKAQRIGSDRRQNVARELSLLETLSNEVLDRSKELDELTVELIEVNGKLWDIEEAKRRCEGRQDFGADFIRLARSVYLENDRRAAIKRRINELTQSDIVEEKSYG